MPPRPPLTAIQFISFMLPKAQAHSRGSLLESLCAAHPDEPIALFVVD
jgi:hypothetical protein